jgi:3-hydroxybutyryl-CoA dehydratase
MAKVHEPHGLGFHDVDVGDVWVSPRRTLTETDVVLFACLTGDFNPLHVDHIFARETPFGRPIAHGLLGLSLVAGLASNSPRMKTIAFLRIVEWNFVKPAFIGDTLWVRTEVVAKEARARGRRGVIRWKRQLFNQVNELLQEGITETSVEA